MELNFNPIPNGITERQTGELKKLKTLSKEFESFFFKEVLTAMRKTVPKNELLNGGNAEEIYKSMMDDRMAYQIANRGGSGIAQAMYNRLSQAYLASAPPAAREEPK